jgi:RimJ/RimL family protein N-acetyltransferase
LNIETKNLRLILQTRDDVYASLAQLQPHEKAEVSPLWLARLESSGPADPWVHGFNLIHRASGTDVGRCGFKAPPDETGAVEIAYGINPEHQGKGYATEAAEALVRFALTDSRVQLVCAHTLPQPNASTRVLTKCTFQKIGEVIDPEDGRVWRWEIPRRPNH